MHYYERNQCVAFSGKFLILCTRFLTVSNPANITWHCYASSKYEVMVFHQHSILNKFTLNHRKVHLINSRLEHKANPDYYIKTNIKVEKLCK